MLCRDCRKKFDHQISEPDRGSHSRKARRENFFFMGNCHRNFPNMHNNMEKLYFESLWLFHFQ